MITKRGETPSRSMNHGHSLFNKNKIVYGTEVKFYDKKNKTTRHHIYKQEVPFRPASLSRGTSDKFPEYKPQGT
jgi:hypothetical protein